MVTRSLVPTDALPRFLALAEELRATKRWADDKELLRHAVIPLVMSAGEPAAVVRNLRATMAELKERTSWWNHVHGGMRILIAAMLNQSGGSPTEFIAEQERATKLFRKHKLRRDGGGEALAIQILAEQTPDRRVTEAQVLRLRSLFEWIRRDHPWAANTGDYPTVALLATTEIPPEKIGVRIEKIYQDLRGRGFKGRGPLIAVSHLLYFHRDADLRCSERFEGLWNEFRSRGLRMQTGDYDELALLAFAPGTASAIASKVMQHREPIAALRPSMGRNTSFSLACGTAFLELVGEDRGLRRLSRIQATVQIQTILRTRQVAAMAAGGAAAA
jgi:hypothetical protein